MAFLSSTITELTSEICRLTAEILEKGFSRDRPQPGYRSGCDQG